jgi:hypothetical protein
MPTPHHLPPSPIAHGSYPQAQVIHVIHHSVHHKHKDSKESKKKSKARSESVEREGHAFHIRTHKLSHSTSQINLPLSSPRPIPFPKAPSHPGSHPQHHHQKPPSRPNTPAQVHYADLPTVPFDRKQSTSNVLQKRRPSISLSSTQQIIYPATPLSPNSLQLPSPQKPLHGILKNKNSIQQLQPLNTANFRYSRCTGRKKAVCVCIFPHRILIYVLHSLQIGINYTHQPNFLRGCVNDARRVRDFLVKHGGYRSSDVYLLTDEPPRFTRDAEGWDSRLIPTKENMIRAMRWLVRDAKQDDSLFFHCKALLIPMSSFEFFTCGQTLGMEDKPRTWTETRSTV